MSDTETPTSMKRIISRIRMQLETPLHCGGGEEGIFTDLPVVRDAFGWYMIPGTTVAGILRHFLGASGNFRAVESLFGWQSGDDGRGSLVSVSDACLIDFSGRVAREVELIGDPPLFPSVGQVRDHVCIDPVTGTAKSTGKFDMELVPPGTQFAFELALNMEGLSGSYADKLLADFKSLIAAIQSSSVQFGGGQTRGLGYIKTISADTREFDLEMTKGLQEYLKLSRGLLFVDDDGGKIVSISEQRISTTSEITLPLESCGPLLVGGGNSPDADITFASMLVPDYALKAFCERKVIPAASVKGAIRGRIFKILGFIGHPEPDKVLDRMFGHIKNGGKIGKVRMPDIILGDDAKTTKVQHVAIDRLTGGALDGALYSEAPVWVEKLPIDVKLKYSALTDLEMGVLIHALMDFSEGDLAVGGGGNRGNGRFRLRDNTALSDVFKGIDSQAIDKALSLAGGGGNGK